MIPLRDNIPARTTPYVNYAIIGICAYVFLSQLVQAPDAPSLIEQYGMIPARVSNPGEEVQVKDVQAVRTQRGIERKVVERPAAEAAVPAWLTPLTCIFLHGGWMHFLGNMWFLYIFGDNTEDRFGHVGYLLFYVAAGVAASLSHYVTAPESTLPTIGASGAIAGVMGAYMRLYPKAHVVTLIPIVFILQVVVLPAPLFLGIWFLIQFFQGVVAVTATEFAGVAWWAHIGGFAIGFVVAFLLDQVHWLRPKVETVRPNTERITHYRVSPHRRRPPGL